MDSHTFGRWLLAFILTGGAAAGGLGAQPAFASATVNHVNVHGTNAAGIIFDFGDPDNDPNFSLAPPIFGTDTAVIPFDIPASCPFDGSAQFVMTGGNAVLHAIFNNNGGWGGGTAEGPAVLSWSGSATTYSGHLNVWGGDGSNAAGQAEVGETFTFNGMSNDLSPQPLMVKISWHGTLSAAGDFTALTSSFTCS